MEIPLDLDRDRPHPLHRQLYDQIRDGVATRRLPPGTRLPSSRELATRLGVGRHTVTAAYDRLVAEGYLEAQVGAWTSVASPPPGRPAHRPPPGASGPDHPPLQYRLARRVGALPTTLHVLEEPTAPVQFDFRATGTIVPLDDWQRTLARHGAALESRSRAPRSPGGDRRLRTQIARYLGAARAVDCTPDQIVITNSDQQALILIAHLTVDIGDHVLIEEPGNPASRLAFQAYGARVVPVPVDDEGVDAAAVARASSPRTRLLYVTPSHQLPTGATLGLARRSELVRWARATGTLIIEDDQDCGYTYGGPTLGSLQSLDPHAVIYVGTLKQAVGGTVGVGYVVVPAALVEPAVVLQWSIDKGPPPFVQSALAEFMASAAFGRHLRRLQRHHRLCRDALREALVDCFGDDVVVGPAPAGTFIHVRWRRQPATAAMIRAALQAQVGLYPAESCYLQPPSDDPGVMMFYGHLTVNEIHEGVRRLADALALRDARDGTAR